MSNPEKIDGLGKCSVKKGQRQSVLEQPAEPPVAQDVKIEVQNSTTIAAVVATGLLGGAAAYYAYKVYQESKVKLPETWTHVGKLKDIYVYPIKSCGPIVVENAECSILGLKNAWLRDRFLMVVDAKSNFITARAYPEMLLIQPTIKGSVLTLSHHDMENISVNLAEVVALKKPSKAYVWSVEVPVLDCGWEVSEWLSRLLCRETHSLRLVYYSSQSARSLRSTTNTFYKFTKNDTGAFPDEVSFNLINESSVEELNSRLESGAVTARNFRPNFVLSGAKAYDEDNWKFVKIGDNVFEIIKPCTRCIMTTIDPETGVRDGKCEPLETLKKYRQLEQAAARRSAGDSPRMGLQMALRGEGGRVALHHDIYVA